MGHFLHNPAVDLLNARLAVDHDIVEIVRHKGDDFLQIRINLTVTAGALRASYGDKAESVRLHYGVKYMVFCLPQQFHGGFGIPILHRGHHLSADIIDGQRHFDTQCRCQPHRRVCINGKDFFVRVLFREGFDGHRRQGCLANSALAGESYDFGCVHFFPFCIPQV